MEFAVLLLATLPSTMPVLWVSLAPEIYPPGLSRLGLDPARCIFAKAGNEAESLGILEVALRGGMAGVAEVRRLPRLSARRLALAAGQGGGIGFLLRRAPAFTPTDSTAPATRWLISPVPSETAGAPRLRAELLYAKGGRPEVFFFEIAKEADDATPPTLTLLDQHDAPLPARTRRAG